MKGHSNARFTVLLVCKEYVAISTVCAFVPLKEEYMQKQLLVMNYIPTLSLLPLAGLYWIMTTMKGRIPSPFEGLVHITFALMSIYACDLM